MLDSTKLQDIKQRFGIIGNAEGLNRAIERAYLVAPTDYSLLIVGESGVGKEHFPKIIHTFSLRKHGTYLAVNCGAIPAGTIDSELFGHVKGAFTGAVTDHKGYFEEADGGTIFLDEVGELPLETQVRLLRVLETGEFMRVGSSQVQKTSVRVVAATNVNLEEAIEAKRFREDLFYRLSTITIRVPALRERKEDIPILFRKFASDCTNRYQMPPLRLTDEAKTLLMQYYFRGNIRQLKNIAEQICILEQKREITPEILRQYLPISEEGKTIALHHNGDNYSTEREILYKLLFEMKHELDDLKRVVAQLSGEGKSSSKTDHTSVTPILSESTADTMRIQSMVTKGTDADDFQLFEEVPSDDEEKEPSINPNLNTATPPTISAATQEATPVISTFQDVERETIRQSLQRNNGSRKAVSRELGIAERTLYRKIKEYNL